jgi:peptidyl-prolyl cis-trans isomerase D
MLQFIRSKAGSWVVKVLLLLIIVAFTSWEINDIFRKDVASEAIATVNKDKITVAQYKAQVYQTLQQFARFMGPNANIETLKNMGYHKMILENLITQAVQKQYTSENKLLIGEEQIRAEIMNQPNFKNQIGQFDSNRFYSFINQSYGSEAAYIKQLQGQLNTKNINEPFDLELPFNSLLNQNLYRYKNEKRVADYVKISIKGQTIPSATDEQLQEYYDKHNDKFMAPEYRSFSLIKLDPKDRSAKISLTDVQIKEEYNKRIADYTRPEKRDATEFILKDQAKAADVAKMLADGKSPEDISKKLGKDNVTHSEWGLVNSDEIPDELKDAILVLNEGDISKPLQSKEGWHVVKIKKVEKGGVDSFDTVKEHLAQQMKVYEGTNQVIELANNMDEKLSDGMTLEEVAKENSVEIMKIDNVNQQGMFKDVASDHVKAPSQEIIRAAFNYAEGEVSGFRETKDGVNYALRVEVITPEAVKPFDMVKDAVNKAWTSEEKRNSANNLAKEITEKSKTESDFNKVANEYNLAVTTSPEFKRSGGELKGALPSFVVTNLFKGKVGEVEMGMVGENFAVAKLKSIIAADPTKDKDGVDKIAKEVTSSYARDLAAQFDNALRKKYKVVVKDELVDTVF